MSNQQQFTPNKLHRLPTIATMSIVNLEEVKEMHARLLAQVTKATLNEMMLKLQLAAAGKTNKEMMDKIKGQLDDWQEVLKKEEKKKEEEKKGKGGRRAGK